MSPFARRFFVALLASISVLPLAGCKHPNGRFIDPFADDVDKKVEGWGLRKLDVKDYPDMRAAWMDKTNLERAILKSLDFLGKQSSQQWYPSPNPGDDITHAQEVATLNSILDMLHSSATPDQFQQAIASRYDVYTSKGYNDKGDVWFTGYYTPIYNGSRTRTAEYLFPIYARPADLVTDPITGKVMGSYPTRRQLMTSDKLRGNELLWFKKPIEPFMIQVQGSAQVKLADGTTVYVGYAGSNGGEHKGLGGQLRDAGKIDPKHVSLPAVLAYFDAHPGELDQYMMNDDRFTFQKIYTEAELREWPTGSLNEQVTPDRSLATDKDIFPRASFVFLDAPQPSPTGPLAPKKTFVLDQDSGGGIRAAGRADIYMGIGDLAGQRAGEEFAQGRMYYIFLKKEFVMGGARAPLGGGPGAATAPRPGGPSVPRPAPAGGEMFPGAVGR
jgi:membrane-bound lytic murein transglycosylase A